MANIKISILFFGIFSLSTFVFSCTKENNDSKEKMDNSMTTESRSFCPDYLDVAGCASTTSGTTLGGTLIYEGCQIPFVYYMVKCDWGVYFEPPVIDWNSVFSTIWLNGGANTPCTDLANKMLSLSIQGKTGELNDLLLDIKKQMSLFAQRRSILFNAQINENFYPCDGVNPPTTYSVVTQESNCTMFCQKIVPGTGIFITEIACGVGCCTRKTPFCINGPNEIVFGSPIFENTVPCSNNSTIWPISITCPQGSSPLEICNPACSKL